MIAYRDAAPADGPALNAMARAAWLETFGPHYNSADRDAYLDEAYGSDGALLRDLRDPMVNFRLAIDGDTIIGYAKLNPPWLADAEPGALQLSQIYVLADHLGGGAGPVLMDWVVDAARTRGATALLLTVWEENHRAHRFYVKRGFVHIGDYAFPVGDKVDRDLIMRLDLTPVEVNVAKALAGVPHGFLGRRGGVSTGIFAGLNVGIGTDDKPEAIAKNRRRATRAVLPGAQLVTVYQDHTPEVVIVTGPLDERPRADALVTATPGLALGVLTADCAPVLFADREAGVVGAAHAGWRGALSGVTDATIAAMESLGARRERIAAAVGPCLGRASFQVTAEFPRLFLEADPANERFFTTDATGTQRFDLEAYVVNRLALAGLRKIEALGLDTYPDAARFFSYRRKTHLNEPDYGRQISIIGIN